MSYAPPPDLSDVRDKHVVEAPRVAHGTLQKEFGRNSLLELLTMVPLRGNVGSKGDAGSEGQTGEIEAKSAT